MVFRNRLPRLWIENRERRNKTPRLELASRDERPDPAGYRSRWASVSMSSLSCRLTNRISHLIDCYQYGPFTFERSAMRYSQQCRSTPARTVIALITACALSACSGLPAARSCAQGDAITGRELVATTLRDLIKSNQGSRDTRLVRYDTLDEFLATNPDCCYIEQPTAYRGETLRLPLDEKFVVNVLYLRRTEGDKPYALHRIPLNPCMSYADDTYRYLSKTEYESAKGWKWAWRAKL